MSDKLREALKRTHTALEQGRHYASHGMLNETTHILDEILDFITPLMKTLSSHPPEAQAEGWQGLWKCDVCGREFSYGIPIIHNDNRGNMITTCPGALRPHDRRKSDEAVHNG